MAAFAGDECQYANDVPSMKQAETQQDRLTKDAIGCRLRRDIAWTCRRESVAMERSWVANDPLTRRIFRCGEQEYQLLHWLDDTSTTADIVKKFNYVFSKQDYYSSRRRFATYLGSIRKSRPRF